MSQTKNILTYLQQGNTITPVEALNKFGSFRLSERIREISKMGYEIENLEKLGHYGRYRLKRPPVQNKLI